MRMGGAHSEMMSDTFFGIFIPSPPVLVHATPFHLARIRVPRCLDVICAWPRDREEMKYATRLLPFIKAGHLFFVPGRSTDDVMLCEITLLYAILLCYDVLRKFVNHMRALAPAEKSLMLPGK